jgi:hypothetical protein
MTDCGWLSDRMPVVALGQSGWTAEEMRHLNGCRMCQREWELVQVAGRLGDTAVVSFDSPAMADSVVQRLGRERELGRLRRRTWSFAGLAAAAAIAAAVWTGGMEREVPGAPASGPVVAGRLAIPLPELDDLQAAELGAVLQMMEEPNVSGVPVDEPSLGDLNSDELKRVLDSWEG